MPKSTVILLLGLMACAAPPELDGAEGGETIDESRLDRSAPNLDGQGCGYPGPGSDGYGIEVGQRVDNFELIDCEGNPIEFADFFCEREDEYGDFNRAVLVNIGAGWCSPCQEETKDQFPEIYPDLHDEGLEIVQVMFQDWEANLPTRSFCQNWKSGQWKGSDGETIDIGVTLAFPVLLDQTNDWTSIYMSDPQAATPVNMLLDANANIRWKLEGQKPANLRQQIELVMDSPFGRDAPGGTP